MPGPISGTPSPTTGTDNWVRSTSPTVAAPNLTGITAMASSAHITWTTSDAADLQVQSDNKLILTGKKYISLCPSSDAVAGGDLQLGNSAKVGDSVSIPANGPASGSDTTIRSKVLQFETDYWDGAAQGGAVGFQSTTTVAGVKTLTFYNPWVTDGTTTNGPHASAVAMLTISPTQIRSKLSGSAATPSIAVGATAEIGLYATATALNFAVDGFQYAAIKNNSGGNASFQTYGSGSSVETGLGSVSVPCFTAVLDLDSGLFFGNNGNYVGVTGGGVECGRFTGGTLAIKSGSNLKAGTFVANGTTPVAVGNTSWTANSIMICALKTTGGAGPILQPFVTSVTPATGFSVTAGVGDTSTYNYVILEVN